MAVEAVRQNFQRKTGNEDSMRTGKISEAVLKRSVLKLISSRHPDCMPGPGVGRDAALVRLDQEGEACVMAASASLDIAASLPVRVKLAVQTAVNNLAAQGALPVGMEMQVFLPEDADEQDLKTIMRAAENIAEKLDMDLLGGHTMVCPSVSRSMISVTALGKTQVKAGMPADDSSARTRYADKEIVVTKSIGMAAVMLLAGEKEQVLSGRFTQDITEVPLHFPDKLSVLPEANIAGLDRGTILMHDLSEGGIFGALWEMAERTGTGLDIFVRQIPIRQETVEISEFFDINPYQSLSQGSLLILTENGEGLVQKLAEAGIPAAVIGRTTAENARILHNKDEIRYLDKPQMDEIYSIL